jgi:predicted RND superfamily exporter protein
MPFEADARSNMNNEDPLRRRYLRWLWIGLGLLVVLAVPAVVHSHAAIGSLFNRPADWIPNSLPEKQEFNLFLDHFSVSDVIMVAWEGSELDSDELARAAAVIQPFCRLSEDETVEDPQAAAELAQEQRQLAWLDLTPEARSVAESVQRICGDAPPLDWVRSGTEMLEQLTSSPINLTHDAAVERLKGTIVGPEGKQTCLLVSLATNGQVHRRDVIPAIRTIIASIVDKTPDQIAVVGGAFEGATVDAESIRTIRVFSPPSALIAAILCLLCLRSVPLTLVILAVASIGEGLVLAAVYYTGTPMNAVLIVLPPLVFVLTVSAGIHLSNYYLDASSEFPELSRAQAAQLAMKAGVAPCVLATGTTVVGLSSLLLVRLEPVRIFGGVASLGVIVTLALLFMVMPGAMVLTRPRHHKKLDGLPTRKSWRESVKLWMRRRLARPWPVIITFLLVAIVLSLGLPRLESSVNVPRMFLPESDIRQQYAWFEEHVGPTVNGELLLTFPAIQEGEDPLERLEIVGQAHRRVLEQGEVGGAMSAITFIPPIPTKRSLAATAKRSVVRTLIRDPDSSLGRLGFIARDNEKEIWRISLQIPQHDQADYRDKIAAIRAAVTDPPLEAKFPVDVAVTGSIVIVQRAQEVLLSDLFLSFLAAFGVIALVMIVMLRNVVGGLIAMAPNLFPTVALFGAMGLVRIPLDIGSVMSASVALGIAVDDTVHLLSRYGSRRARGLGQIRAAYGALAQCGWAMFQTTLVCGVALMAYWFSDFVPTSRFSLFMFALLASALLGVIFLLPTLMASPLGRFLSRPIGASAEATLYADSPAEDDPTDARRLPTRWQKSQPPAPATTRRDPQEPDPKQADPKQADPRQPGTAASKHRT